MIIENERNIKPVVLESESYSKVTGKVLVSPENGWEDYVMRQFEIEKDGYSADHSHDFPHIVYVLDGEGTMMMEGKEYPIKKGSFSYVPNNAQHQLLNTGSSGEHLKFICIVPKENHQGF